jgi:hypothetical protein
MQVEFVIQHEYWKFEDNMDILNVTPKGQNMDTYDQYYIHKFNKEAWVINK